LLQVKQFSNENVTFGKKVELTFEQRTTTDAGEITLPATSSHKKAITIQTTTD
jgi:hypothetical protein